MATAFRCPYRQPMNDPLLARAQLAIEESKALRREKHVLQAEQLRSREALRLAIFESAMCRTEARACREDRE